MGGVDIKKLKQEILQADNPVGCLRLQVVNTNPAEYLVFGEWVLLGKGKVPVGVDTDDTDFNTVEKEIGSKTVNIKHSHEYGISIPYYYGMAGGERVTSGVGVYDYEKNKEIKTAIENLEKEFTGNGRILIRPSGTEPLVRVMIEGKDEKVLEERAKKLAKLIEKNCN